MGILVNSGSACALLLASIVISSPASPQTWEPICEDGEVCRLEGTRAVRYGGEDRYVYGVATNTIRCTSEVFGNPSTEVTKRCYAWQSAAERAALAAERQHDDWVRGLEEQVKLLPQRDDRIHALEEELKTVQAELDQTNAELEEVSRELRRESRRGERRVIIRREPR